MEILIVAPHGSVDIASLGPVPGETRVTAICWASHAPASSGVDVIPIPARRGMVARIREWARRHTAHNPIMRGAMRLTSFDDGRWFWLGASRTPATPRAVRDARVIVAADRDAIYTAWRWQREARRSGRRVSAVYGYPAARAAIAEAACG